MTTATEPGLHLNVNILNAGIFAASWRFPGTDPLSSYRLEHYLEIARAAEAAAFDAVFLADGPVLDGDLRHRPGNSFEPSALLARIASETRRIGLIGTLSSTYNDPGELAFRLAGLDALSGGRFGWNVVTTAGSAAAANFGRAGEPPREERYARAEAVVAEVVRAWASGTGPESPQGRPVIVQAGGSPEGLRLAGRFADAVFTVAQTAEDAGRYAGSLTAAAGAHGRERSDIAILPGLSFVLAGSGSEAARRRAQLDELLPLAYAKARLSGQLGLELDGIDLDRPLRSSELPEPAQASGSRGFYESLLGVIDRERPTVRQLLLRLGGGTGHRIVVGSPEQIADDISAWHATGSADGFNLMPDVLPEGLFDFTERVVPILRRRGVFRREYAADTLRGHLGLPARRVPRAGTAAEAPERHDGQCGATVESHRWSDGTGRASADGLVRTAL